MTQVDYDQPWYHGSPSQLTVLRRGSWLTQFKELAKAFAHKPSLISFGDDGLSTKHNGLEPGYLYTVAEPLQAADVIYLQDTAQTHWQSQRDLAIRLVCALPLDDPPQLSEEEIALMRREIPQGSTGFITDQDAE